MTNGREKPTVSEQAGPTETITNLSWITLGLGPGLSGEKPENKRLSYRIYCCSFKYRFDLFEKHFISWK